MSSLLLGRGARCLAAAISLLLSTAADASNLQGHPPAAEDRARTSYLPLHPAAWGVMHLPRGSAQDATPPVVILIGDAGGQDGRPALYATRLLSAGLAVLEADYSENAVHDGGLQTPELVPLALRLPLALTAIRGVRRAGPVRVAALGIGEGARAVLAAPRDTLRHLAAAVLVQPGCDAPLIAAASRHAAESAGEARLLLVHGDLDPAEYEACATLETAVAGVRRLVVRGAGFGWDAEPAKDGRVMLADPANPERHRQAYPDPQRAQMVLDRMLLFLISRLDSAQR
jgi:dienelactone hydrolase